MKKLIKKTLALTLTLCLLFSLAAPSFATGVDVNDILLINDPVDPIDPVDPVDPAGPIDLIDPTDPTDPDEPGEPVETPTDDKCTGCEDPDCLDCATEVEGTGEPTSDVNSLVNNSHALSSNTAGENDPPVAPGCSCDVGCDAADCEACTLDAGACKGKTEEPGQEPGAGEPVDGELGDPLLNPPAGEPKGDELTFEMIRRGTSEQGLFQEGQSGPQTIPQPRIARFAYISDAMTAFKASIITAVSNFEASLDIPAAVWTELGLDPNTYPSTQAIFKQFMDKIFPVYLEAINSEPSLFHVTSSLKIGWSGYLSGGTFHLTFISGVPEDDDYFNAYVPDNKTDYDIAKAKYNAAKAALIATYTYAGMSQTEYALALHDALVLTMKYNHPAADPAVEDPLVTFRNSFNAYGAIVEQTAVCQGYALAYIDLLKDVGIDAVYVSGSMGGPHAWNLVKIDGAWYYVDVTSDDPGFGADTDGTGSTPDGDGNLSGFADHEFFLLSQAEFDTKPHIPDSIAPLTAAAAPHPLKGLWDGIESGLFFYGGNIYYKTNNWSTTGSLMCRAFSKDSTATAVTSSIRLPVRDGNNLFFYSPSITTNGGLYYYPLGGAADSIVDISDKIVGFDPATQYIAELHAPNNGKLEYTICAKPNGPIALEGTIDVADLGGGGGDPGNPDIAGTVVANYAGELVFGKTLTVDVTGVTVPAGAAGVEYQWYRSSTQPDYGYSATIPAGATAILNETGASYTTVAADVGKYIFCVVKAPDHNGYLLSQIAGPAKMPVVGKADGPAVVGASAAITSGVATLTAAEGVNAIAQASTAAAPEASSSGWVAVREAGTLTFPTLNLLVENKVYVHWPETATHKAGPVSSLTIAKIESYSLTVKASGVTASTSANYALTNIPEGVTVTLTFDAGAYLPGTFTKSPETLVISTGSSTTVTFTMPAGNVTISGTPRVDLGATGFSYEIDDTFVADGTPKDPYAQIASVGGYSSTIVDDDSARDAEIMNRTTSKFYPSDSSGNMDKSNPLTALPSAPGKYWVECTYAGDDFNRPYSQSFSFVINPASPTPAATAGESSITVTGLTTDDLYICIPSTQPAPTSTSSDWRAVTLDQDGKLTITGLTPEVEYKVYAMRRINGTLSAISSVKATPLHTYSYTVTPASLSFNARPGYTSVASKNVTVTNNSTSTASIKVFGLEASPTKFGVNGTNFGVEIAPGESKTFAVTPELGRGLGTWTETVTFVVNDKNDTLLAKHDVALSLEVAAKIPVTITDPTAPSNLVYDGTAKSASGSRASVASGQAAYTGALEYEYEGTMADGNDTPYPSTSTAPMLPGTYTVTVKVPDSAPDHAGSSNSVSFTITPRNVTVNGLNLKTREYDGTTTVEVNKPANFGYSNFVGLIAADVSTFTGFDVSASQNYADANAGTGKALAAGSVIYTLTGSRAFCYNLVQPTLTGTVTKKSVYPTMDPVTKVYDGTTSAGTITFAFPAGSFVGTDSLTLSYTNNTFVSKNVGTRAITLGTQALAGDGLGNYNVVLPTVREGTITAKEVSITFAGNGSVPYNGKPHPVTASYPTLGSDVPRVSISYDGSATAPTNVKAGGAAYNVVATINDTNYVVSDGSNATTLTITPATLNLADINATVAYTDQREKTNSFVLTSPDKLTLPTGTYTIDSTTDPGAVIDTSAISGSKLLFKLKAGLDAASVGKTATITVKFTPASANFAECTAKLNITVASESVTVSLIGAPTTVNLGDALDITGLKMKLVFDDGRADVLYDVTAADISGFTQGAAPYDPGMLGVQTVTVTHPDVSTRTATFNVEVLDVVTGLTIVKPTKLDYEWKVDTALDLAGGTVKPIMLSGANIPAVPLTMDMLNVTNAILDAPGRTLVSVDHAGYSEPVGFVIAVSASVPITNTTGSGPKVVDMEDETDPTQDPNFGGNDKSIIELLVEGSNSTDIRDLADLHGILGKLLNRWFMDVSLVDNTGAVIGDVGGKVLVQLPYPEGMGSSGTYYLMAEDGGALTDVPFTKTGDGILFWLDDASISIVLGFAQPTNSGSGSWSGTMDELKAKLYKSSPFWLDVTNTTNSVKPGSVVGVNAKNNDQMPLHTMKALKDKDATIIITWSGGDDITFTGEMARAIEYREYYPLAYLAQFAADWLGAQIPPPKTDDPEEGEAWLAAQQKELALNATRVAGLIGADTVALTAADDGEAYTMTPASAGIVTLPESIKKAASETAILLMEDTVAEGGSNTALWVLLVVVALGLLGAGFVLNRKRKEQF